MPSFEKKFLIALFSLAAAQASAGEVQWFESMSKISANLLPSQYQVSSINGSSEVIGTEPSLGLPTDKLYTFTLCLTHPTNSSPFEAVDLSIEGASVPLIPQLVDKNCISWIENINYHFTAPARYITLSRTLRISGILTLVNIPFQFAINPWLHGETSSSAEIADFIKIKPRNPIAANHAEAALHGEDLQEREASLVANDARVSFQEIGLDSHKGGQFSMDFRINPLLELRNLVGQSVYPKLSQGEFAFEAYLISTFYEGDIQRRRVLTPDAIKGIAQFRDGALAFIQEIRIPVIPSRGRLELAVSLRPKQTVAYLKEFSGIYVLGNYSDLKENLFARLKTGFTSANPEFNLETYLNLRPDAVTNQTANNAAKADIPDGLRPLKYEFDPLGFRFTRIGDESALRRQVFYQVKACVHNGSDNSSPRGYHFSVTKANSDGNSAPTLRPIEYDGCIYWDEQFDHKVYLQQRLYKVQYRIQNAELSLDETLTAYINPWDPSLSRDGRTMDNEAVTREAQLSKNQAQLFVGNFKIQTRTIQYGLDASLSLKIQKQVHLLLEPQVLNYSNLSRGIEAREPIRDGLWKIRWALLRNRYEDEEEGFQPLARGEFIGTATQGRIVSPLNLEFNDFRFVDSRNYLMLEIAPVNPELVAIDPQHGIIPKDSISGEFAQTVDTSSGLKAQTFIGPVRTSTDDEIGYLVPHPFNPALGAFLPGQATSQLADNEKFGFEKSAPSWDSLALIPNNQISENNQTKLLANQKRLYLSYNEIQSWNLDEPTQNIALRRAMGPSAFTITTFSDKYQRSPFMVNMLVRTFSQNRLTAELEDRLCFYFFDQNPVHPIQVNNRLLPWRRSDAWLKKCLRAVGREGQSFFRAQLETPVESISKVKFIGSTKTTLNVGASFNVSSSESVSLSNSVSASTQVGLNLKISEMLSFGANAAYSVSQTHTHGRSANNGLSIANGVSLNVRKLSFNISGSYSQRCLTVSLNPTLYLTEESELVDALKRSSTAKGEIFKFLTQKGRFCFTEEPGKIFQTQEHYYFITQDYGGVGFIDNPDLRNRPLLLQLRGEAAYENFLRLISARFAVPQETKNLDEGVIAIGDSTQKALHLAVPTIPGLLIESANRL
jgi:hypothetical protein